jgi:hypothetical protein
MLKSFLGGRGAVNSNVIVATHRIRSPSKASHEIHGAPRTTKWLCCSYEYLIGDSDSGSGYAAVDLRARFRF